MITVKLTNKMESLSTMALTSLGASVERINKAEVRVELSEESAKRLLGYFGEILSTIHVAGMNIDPRHTACVAAIRRIRAAMQLKGHFGEHTLGGRR